MQPFSTRLSSAGEQTTTDILGSNPHRKTNNRLYWYLLIHDECCSSSCTSNRLQSQEKPAHKQHQAAQNIRTLLTGQPAESSHTCRQRTSSSASRPHTAVPAALRQPLRPPTPATAAAQLWYPFPQHPTPPLLARTASLQLKRSSRGGADAGSGLLFEGIELQSSFRATVITSPAHVAQGVVRVQRDRRRRDHRQHRRAHHHVLRHA